MASAQAGDDDEVGPSSSDADNPPERAAAPGAVETALEVVTEAGTRGVDTGWLRDRLALAVAHLDRPIARVTVTVVGDERMRALHEAYRGAADTTDVLTFQHSDAGEPIDADVVVDADEGTRRAAERGHALERELLLYALHGVLHCAGFDDHATDDFEAIHAEEDRILAAIGVGPTFHDRGSTS